MRNGSLLALLASGLSAGAPIALAAMGGLYTEAAGSLSVALEGAMLAGAFFAVLVAKLSGSLLAASFAALAAGLLVAAIVGLASSRLGADIFVAGLAANLLAPSAASLISEAVFGTKGVLTAPALAIPPGEAFWGLSPVEWALFGLAVLLVIAYSATPFGIRLRAVGERNEAAGAAGLDAGKYRLAAHLVAGGASGIAGATLAMQIAAWVPGMSSGRGWIALVAIYLGGKRPGGVIAASLAFGLLIALSNASQALPGAPAELLLGLPYALTGLALVAAGLVARRRKWRA